MHCYWNVCSYHKNISLYSFFVHVTIECVYKCIAVTSKTNLMRRTKNSDSNPNRRLWRMRLISRRKRASEYARLSLPVYDVFLSTSLVFCRWEKRRCAPSTTKNTNSSSESSMQWAKRFTCSDFETSVQVFFSISISVRNVNSPPPHSLVQNLNPSLCHYLSENLHSDFSTTHLTLECPLHNVSLHFIKRQKIFCVDV